jgi:magnesium chelatase subunit H
MPKRTTAAEHQGPVRVVLVTMDAHLASAAQRAQQQIHRAAPGVTLEVHAAALWGDNPARLHACETAIAEADIVLVTMLFMEDHFRPLLNALHARRTHCDAMVCLMSATEVTQLTRMGRLDMQSPATGPLALLRRLRGAAKARQDGKAAVAGTTGAKQLRMLRRLPKLLRFIPGTAQDLRLYFQAMQYWLAGSEDNVAGLVLSLVDRYAQGPRAGWQGALKVAAPREYPDVGLYHPRLPQASRLSERVDELPRVRQAKGTVGVLLLRSYVLAGNTAHYDGVIGALEAQGYAVIPAFAAGLDFRPVAERYWLKDGKACIDALVSLTGFSLVGGPAFNDARAAQHTLALLDVPYLAAAPLEFQTLDAWRQSDRGMLPVESTIMVALPELDGATGSMVYGGRSGDGRDMQAAADRTALLAARVARWVKLRTKPRDQRRLAVVLFCFPPNAGNVGTAAMLAVFESLHNTLQALAEQGYRVAVPPTVEALREAITQGNASRYGTPANVHALVSADDHVRREPHLAAIEAQWGPAPGRVQTNGQQLFVLGAQFGEVFVGVQPGFGYEGDPMRLLFEKGFAPTHAFSAFYRWLREDFAADAVLHFGTHGALEFMPGKQVGLSEACWPERLLGDLPNVYLYAGNNPSEGALAKRRAAATLVTHATPPLAHVQAYQAWGELREALTQWHELSATATAARTEALQGMRELAQQLDLTQDIEDPDACVSHWQAELDALTNSLMPCGLHVVGQAPTPEQRVAWLQACGEAWHQVQWPHAALQALVNNPSENHWQQWLAPETEQAQASWEALQRANEAWCGGHELQGLLQALDGRYVMPAPGGDVLRNPEVLPTGRNMHGFDPFGLPSAHAQRSGQRQAERLLARYRADHGAWPQSVAMVLWGTDNLKTGGDAIAQALHLMGAAPRFDSYGRLAGATLVPLEQLGRPRIDVVLTLSGIFRDLLPLQIRLLAEAAYLAAEADEPEDMNWIRKHVLACQRAHGCDLESAALRVFSNAEGTYGANVNLLIDSGQWDQADELAETFSQRKGFAYGRAGQPQAQQALLREALSHVALSYQNLESVELGVTSVDTYFDSLGGMTRAVAKAQGVGSEDMPVYIGDQTRDDDAHAQVRSLREQVALETRGRMLNPTWADTMLRHGYEGVQQIEAHLTHTMGWSATTGQVEPWVYQRLSETYMLDEAMRQRLAALNPTASARMASRLLEASERNFWQPSAEHLEALRRASDTLEDSLEGIQQGAAA